MAMHDSLKDASLQEVSNYILKSDKDLFLKLKDGHYTLDQLKARISQRKTGIGYVVLDDLKQYINPKFFEKPPQEEQKKDEILNSQVKQRKSQCFQSVPRDGGQRHRFYQNMPDSMKLDFHPKEICGKAKKRKNLKVGLSVLEVKPPKDVE